MTKKDRQEIAYLYRSYVSGRIGDEKAVPTQNDVEALCEIARRSMSAKAGPFVQGALKRFKQFEVRPGLTVDTLITKCLVRPDGRAVLAPREYYQDELCQDENCRVVLGQELHTDDCQLSKARSQQELDALKGDLDMAPIDLT
jgi:hypothetical protein